MSKQVISEAIPNAISLQALEAGAKHSGLPSGRQIDLFGLEVAHTSLSQLPGAEKEQTIKGTCGLSGTNLSKPVSLQLFLENRLMPLLNMNGLIPLRKTWNRIVTPLGRELFQLQVSVPRISGKDYGLSQSIWTTPAHSDGSRGGTGITKNMTGSSLAQLSKTASWPTVTSRDYKDGSPCDVPINGLLGRTVWMTVTSSSPEGRSQEGMQRRQEKRAATGRKSLSPGSLDEQAQMYSGTAVTGSNAPMENKGRLNPEFCRWLMGFPDGWSKYADMVMP